jgi:hypothetical protein
VTVIFASLALIWAPEAMVGISLGPTWGPRPSHARITTVGGGRGVRRGAVAAPDAVVRVSRTRHVGRLVGVIRPRPAAMVSRAPLATWAGHRAASRTETYIGWARPGDRGRIAKRVG